jgi:hypothetical protein
MLLGAGKLLVGACLANLAPLDVVFGGENPVLGDGDAWREEGFRGMWLLLLLILLLLLLLLWWWFVEKREDEKTAG